MEAYNLHLFAYSGKNIIFWFVLEWGLKRSENCGQQQEKKKKEEEKLDNFDITVSLAIPVLLENHNLFNENQPAFHKKISIALYLK